MRFQLLGPLAVAGEGGMIDVRRPKQRALLAALLLEANHVVSTDALIAGLWEGREPDNAAKTLQVHVSGLRKLVGAERLQTHHAGYVLVVGDDEYDVREFELLLRSARSEDPPAAAVTLRRGLALWRGEPLADFAGHRFAQAEIARLTALRLVTTEDAIDLELAGSSGGTLLAELEGLVKEHPLRERLRRQLMLALYRAGRQADALEVYRTARSVLHDELGIEPGRALRDLERAILGQDPALDVVSREPDSEALETTRGVFVGRAPELEELVEGLEDALAGCGRLVLLAGEPGIGKSRLADELIRRSRSRGAQALIGRCWEAGGAPAYWPWIQSLRSHVRATEPGLLRSQLGSRAAEVAQLVPELRAIVPGIPEPSVGDSEGARLRLFDATTEFLRAAAEHRPVVLLLDDLHAADAPSLLLLQYLARELRSTRILVVAAYRNIDPLPATPLRTFLAEATREPGTRRLLLTGLSRDDVSEYVELTVSDQATPTLASTLYEETEGNPLFMVEMVRLLAAESRGPETGGGDVLVPETVRDVIDRRFARLSDETNRVLVLAAMLGREFSIPALARMAEVGEDELLETLDEAMNERILSAVPGMAGHLRFAHVLMRDALYENLSTARRVRLHRVAVAALAGLYGDNPGPHLSELAHHAIAGSDFGRALDYARRAGDRALAMLAFEEAARLYQVALDAAELADGNDTVKCELLLAQGEAQTLAGEGPTARSLLLQASDLARSEGEAELFARAAIAYGGRDIWGPRVEWDPRLLRLLEEALELNPHGDTTIRSQLLTRTATTLRGAKDRSRPEALAREGHDIARRLGDVPCILVALEGALAVADGPETAAERREAAAELIRRAEAAGDLERLFGAHEHMLYATWALGDGRGMQAAADAMRRLVERVDLRMFTSLVAVADALFALWQGRFAAAEPLIEAAFRLGERAQPWTANTDYRLQTFLLRRHRGELGGYEAVLRSSLDDYPGYRIFDCALSSAYAHLDRRDECREVFESMAGDSFECLSREGDWLTNLCFLGEACSYLGDRERAQVLIELLAPYAGQNAVACGEVVLGTVAQHLGRLEGEVERFEDAEAHFETAIEMNTRLGARPWLAEAQADYGRMLLARGQGRDVARATALLAEAHATYEELGMVESPWRSRETSAAP